MPIAFASPFVISIHRTKHYEIHSHEASSTPRAKTGKLIPVRNAGATDTVHRISVPSCSNKGSCQDGKNNQASYDEEQKIDKSKDGTVQMPPYLHTDRKRKVQPSSNFKCAQIELFPKQNWQSNPVLQIQCGSAYLRGADSLPSYSWMLWSLPPACYCCETLGCDARKVPTQLIS